MSSPSGLPPSDPLGRPTPLAITPPQQQPLSHVAMAAAPPSSNIPPSLLDLPGPDPRNLIVNYIPTPVTDQELTQMFEQYGELISARVILDRVTRQPKGYGFVKFKNVDDARRAMDAMNGFTIHNKRLKITTAKGPQNEIIERAIALQKERERGGSGMGTPLQQPPPPQQQQQPMGGMTLPPHAVAMLGGSPGAPTSYMQGGMQLGPHGGMLLHTGHPGLPPGTIALQGQPRAPQYATLAPQPGRMPQTTFVPGIAPGGPPQAPPQMVLIPFEIPPTQPMPFHPHPMHNGPLSGSSYFSLSTDQMTSSLQMSPMPTPSGIHHHQPPPPPGSV